MKDKPNVGSLFLVAFPPEGFPKATKGVNPYPANVENMVSS